MYGMFRIMPEFHSENTMPQFGTAEYVGTPPPGGDRCKVCQQAVTGEYYRIHGNMVCGGCTERARHELPSDSHEAYIRGLLFGVGGAIAGLIGYAAVVIILQGWVIGYFSLAVGWLVAKAMLAGSKGLGGRRYQIAAVLLTYAAVSMAAVPIAIWQLNHRLHPPARAARTRAGQPDSQSSGQEPMAADGQSAQQDSQQNSQTSDSPAARPSAHPPRSLGNRVASLALLGLSSPFWELRSGSFYGIVNLVILFVGMRIAWQLTAGRSLAISGPFKC